MDTPVRPAQGALAVEAVEALLDRRSDGPPPRDRSRLARHRSALEKIGTPNRRGSRVRSITEQPDHAWLVLIYKTALSFT